MFDSNSFAQMKGELLEVFQCSIEQTMHEFGEDIKLVSWFSGTSLEEFFEELNVAA